MELTITVFLLINFIISLSVIHSLKDLRSNEVEIFSAPLETIEGCSCECMTKKSEEIFLPPVEEVPVVVPKVDESYKAWKNRVEEPTVAPPSPHGPPPKPGPLERPYGFTR